MSPSTHRDECTLTSSPCIVPQAHCNTVQHYGQASYPLVHHHRTHRSTNQLDMTQQAPLFSRQARLGAKPDAPMGTLHIGRRKVEWTPDAITAAQPVLYSLSDVVGMQPASAAARPLLSTPTTQASSVLPRTAVPLRASPSATPTAPPLPTSLPLPTQATATKPSTSSTHSTRAACSRCACGSCAAAVVHSFRWCYNAATMSAASDTCTHQGTGPVMLTGSAEVVAAKRALLSADRYIGIHACLLAVYSVPGTHCCHALHTPLLFRTRLFCFNSSVL